MSKDFPAPQITPLSEPYWQGLKAGELRFQRCGSCGHAWLPPRAECPNCLKPEWAWEAASGRGRLVSRTVYHISHHPAFDHRLPYNVAVVELMEGPRLITNIVNPDEHGGLAIDKPVALAIEEEHGVFLARFRLNPAHRRQEQDLHLKQAVPTGGP